MDKYLTTFMYTFVYYLAFKMLLMGIKNLSIPVDIWTETMACIVGYAFLTFMYFKKLKIADNILTYAFYASLGLLLSYYFMSFVLDENLKISESILQPLFMLALLYVGNLVLFGTFKSVSTMSASN